MSIDVFLKVVVLPGHETKLEHASSNWCHCGHLGPAVLAHSVFAFGSFQSRRRVRTFDFRPGFPKAQAESVA